MKTNFTILLLLAFVAATAQTKFKENHLCANPNAPFDVLVVNKKKVRYQIISYAEMTYGKWHGEYAVDCILPDYTSKSDQSEIKAIARSLKKFNRKFTSFTFYKSCEVYNISMSSKIPVGERERKRREGYLGTFEILN